ncbi:uncharacterized protein MONBRDRAFT_5661 [Monosiga brevicollis MX1]|uniref:Uncharacterized protein n=1 Tax=Monosiga brevicollis TaxID=81824 RepID=A9US32_MONBE|nr:uncharacterized protein MONBRDRAFT_5661 [Monosiga brevicollis MX1]EDQ91708.1 predicted protein [Monosiga brevicollis MX1]|eukprot:XP_001742994.1 hypothetical protein [Monosiga brevicollis MX1]
MAHSEEEAGPATARTAKDRTMARINRCSDWLLPIWTVIHKQTRRTKAVVAAQITRELIALLEPEHRPPTAVVDYLQAVADAVHMGTSAAPSEAVRLSSSLEEDATCACQELIAAITDIYYSLQMLFEIHVPYHNLMVMGRPIRRLQNHPFPESLLTEQLMLQWKRLAVADARACRLIRHPRSLWRRFLDTLVRTDLRQLQADNDPKPSAPPPV